MRRVLMVVHKKRESAKELALHATEELAKHNIEVIDVDNFKEGIEFELILVLGGDGSLLSAAYYSRKYDIPMIGINLGHVGFLAEMDPEDISVVVEKIAKKDYTIQLRTTLEITITKPDGTILKDWALNEAALSRKDHVHPAYVSIGVDDEPISTFGGDGVIFATPTGSTAYAFSAGGPVVWPDVDALVMVPLAGHALFTKPLIVGTNSKLQATVLPDQWADLALCCDGTRVTDVPGNSQVSVVASDKKIKLARMHNTPFSSRLVARFNLPVEGWRSTNSGEKNKK